MTDDELVERFEQGSLSGDDFPHERHVRLAWALTQRYGRKEAMNRLRIGIRSLAERAGHPEKYHETITRAWLELVAGAEDLEHHPELLDKRLLSHYYSPARLAGGRDRWLAPDLRPLPSDRAAAG